MRFIGLCCALVLIGGRGFAEEPDIVRYVQQGEAFAAQGQLEPAIAEYEKALAAGAGSAAFLNRLGVFYLQAQKLSQARRTFHLSLREKPAQLPVLSRLGEVFLASGQLDSAIYYVRQARLLAPQASPVPCANASKWPVAGGAGSSARVVAGGPEEPTVVSPR